MILDIVKVTTQAGYDFLIKPNCIDVTEFNRELHDLCANMAETMFERNGVGLAAPQIGKSLNLFVMRVEPEIMTSRKYTVLVNPHTVIQVGDSIKDKEGCLSIPGVWGFVDRFKEVGAVYQDTTGKRLPGHFAGYLARVYQHEYDHLEGTLFWDRADEVFKNRK